MLARVLHPFFDVRRPLVFAHRGGGALAPENTIAAFDNGLALGADGLELDVRLSRDGVVVVHHDAMLDRTTNRRGAVAAPDAASWREPTPVIASPSPARHPFRGRGIGVPALGEVLRRYRDCRVIVEMKINSADFAARRCRGRAVGGRRGPGVPGVVWPARAARGPRARAGPGHQRGARGGAAGRCIDRGAGGRSSRGATPAIRSRSAPEPRESCRQVSSAAHMRRARRSGLDGGHRGRCPPPSRLGSGRADYRPPGCTLVACTPGIEPGARPIFSTGAGPHPRTANLADARPRIHLSSGAWPRALFHGAGPPSHFGAQGLSRACRAVARKSRKRAEAGRRRC